VQAQLGISPVGALTRSHHRQAPSAPFRQRLGALCVWCLAGCGALPPQAALDNPEAPLQQAIVGGTQSAAADYPATGVIIYRSQRHGMSLGAMLCSATLIAPDVVIAAGHCDAALLGETHYPVSFYFTLSLDVSESGAAAGVLPADAVRITRFMPHPEFSLDNLGTGLRFAKDIALLVLEHSIEHVAPAVLIRQEQADALVGGADVFIVGYGRRHALTLGAEDMGIKYQGTSKIHEVGAFEMQIGHANPGSYKCYGDSGGPTYMHLADDVETLVGITSRIYTHGNCGTGGTDTRIDPYLPWIQRMLQESCRTGLRPSCRPPHELPQSY
jgi:hypothetical protein